MLSTLPGNLHCVSESSVFNTSPRPRMLIRGLGGKSNQAEIHEIGRLAGSCKWITSLREVAQSEWDVLVTDEPLLGFGSGSYPEPAVEPHLFVVYRAPDYSQRIDDRSIWKKVIGHATGHIKQQLKRCPMTVPERVAPLMSALEDVARTRDGNKHEYFVHTYRGVPAPDVMGSSSPSAPRLDPPSISPFLMTDDDKILAGRYERTAGGPEVRLLPSDVPSLPAWVAAALGEWRRIDPSRFPGVPDWAEEPEWETPREREIRTELVAVGKEYEAKLGELRARADQLKADMTAARQEGDEYERALLTANGHELVPVVMRALDELGFQTVDHDALLRETHGERFTAVQDIDVTDHAAPGWIALAEVKGYSSGAKLTALSQLGRFQRSHKDETGEWANRLWYIANHFKNRDPDAREWVLQSNDDLVRSFAEDDDGLVIDTVQLFHLLRAVRDGKLTTEDARRSLRESTGRYAVPD
jgi:hypothetical protein